MDRVTRQRQQAQASSFITPLHEAPISGENFLDDNPGTPHGNIFDVDDIQLSETKHRFHHVLSGAPRAAIVSCMN